MPKKPTSPNSKTTKTPSKSFARRHRTLLIVVGIIVAMIVAPIVLLYGLKINQQMNLANEKKQFQEIKQDMLTLQTKLNELDKGKWEYEEGCTRSGGGFSATITGCGLGLNRDYDVKNQQEIDTITQKTNSILISTTKGLFKPHKGGYALSSPQLNNVKYSETTDEGMADVGDELDSSRVGNSIDCSYYYNLSTSKSLGTESGKLHIHIGCWDHTSKTYFDRLDRDPEYSDFKAEEPL